MDVCLSVKSRENFTTGHPHGTFPSPESFCIRDKCGPSSCFTNWTDKGPVKPGPQKQSKRRKDKSAQIGLHRPRALLAVNRVQRAESGLRSVGGQMKATSPRSGEMAASPFLGFQQKTSLKGLEVVNHAHRTGKDLTKTSIWTQYPAKTKVKGIHRSVNLIWVWFRSYYLCDI